MRVWNRTVLQYWSVEQNCVTVLKEIQLSLRLWFIPLPTEIFQDVSVSSEHKTTKVMIYTYWRWISVTGEREDEQDKRMEPVRSVQCAVSRKTGKYLITSHCLKPLWTRDWWISGTLGQCQVTTLAFSTGFQWCYVSSKAGNLRLPREISAHCGSENCDDKMQHLVKLETDQRLYYIAKCEGGNWVVMRVGGARESAPYASNATTIYTMHRIQSATIFTFN